MYEEFINKKYGNLTVKEVSRIDKKTRAICLCECGDWKSINFNDLKRGRIKTCGCTKKKHISLSGTRQGKLQIFEKVKHKSRAVIYRCLCDCGVEKNIRHKCLVIQNQQSCGCTFREDKRKQLKSKHSAWKGIGDISGHHFAAIKHNAKKRNISFDLTKEYLWDLFVAQNKKCKLSGIDLDFGVNSSGVFTASLDRIDSSQGYLEGNVQWLHKDVNYMKQSYSVEYFLELCQKITNNL